jgi:hypothetical protein
VRRQPKHLIVGQGDLPICPGRNTGCDTSAPSTEILTRLASPPSTAAFRTSTIGNRGARRVVVPTSGAGDRQRASRGAAHRRRIARGRHVVHGRPPLSIPLRDEPTANLSREALDVPDELQPLLGLPRSASMATTFGSSVGWLRAPVPD